MRFDRIDYNKAMKVVNGTSFVGEINIEPKKIVQAFGNPDPSDGYKVSGEYVFLSEDEKAVFTLYDWKWTTLYDENNPFTPEEFWKSRDKQVLNIGGHSDVSLPHFKRWIRINSRM
jgi:hypothetical protein